MPYGLSCNICVVENPYLLSNVSAAVFAHIDVLRAISPLCPTTVLERPASVWVTRLKVSLHVRDHDVSKLDVNVEGTSLEGTTRTVMEPRIKYVLSQRVNASVYYRYTKIAPDDSGSRIPGSTTNEAGLDIHISIQ